MIRSPLSTHRLRPLPTASRSPAQRGFTLIEVMVALIVLVLGVLGSAAMMLTSLRDNKQSALRSQASYLAYELSDLMRVNPGYESVFTGSVPAMVSACYTGTGCQASDMAASDYNQWAAKLTSTTPPVLGLPNVTWKICRDSSSPNSMSTCDQLAASPLVVKFKWDEKYNNGKYVTDLDQTAVDKPSLVVPLRPY